MESIHERLKRLRLAKGVSLEDAGKALDVSWQTVQQWELDTEDGTAPARKRQKIVADYYGVSISYLLTGLDVPPHQPISAGDDIGTGSRKDGPRKIPSPREKLIAEISALIEEIDDPGLKALASAAKSFAVDYPRVKQTPKSSR